VSSVLLQVNLILQNALRKTTLMQSMTLFMRWQEMKLDTEKPLRDYLRDTLDKLQAE